MIEAIKSWHEAARPEPTQENLRVQIHADSAEDCVAYAALKAESMIRNLRRRP